MKGYDKFSFEERKLIQILELAIIGFSFIKFNIIKLSEEVF